MQPTIPQDAADAAARLVCPARTSAKKHHGSFDSIEAQATSSYRRLFKCKACGLVFGISSAALVRVLR